MTVEALGLTADTFGTLLIAFAAIRVHHRVLHEHKIDNVVFKAMKREKRLALFGFILIGVGYCLQMSIIFLG